MVPFLRPRVSSVASIAILLSLALALGCGVVPQDPASSPTSGTLTVSGRLHGGQQAVTGARIQLYAANMVTNQGASTALLNQTVTTDSNGFFRITGDYTCPATNPLVYIVATGGNPGLSGQVNNSDLALMSLLGTCNALLSSGDATTIFINELTTVASVQAVSSFMTDYAHIGSAPSNPTALAGAFQNASYEVNYSSGQFNGSGAYIDPAFVTLNTLSDIIATCVNSPGGTSGDGSRCGTLLADTSATDTVTAALHMVQSPGTNAAALYALIPANPPFQPYLTSVPSDFTTTVGITLPAAIGAGTLDSSGHIWLYTGGYSYNTVTDTSTDNPGLITVYDNNFNALFTISPGTGGLYYPVALASNSAGHVIAVNSNNTISEFTSTGSPVSPAAGWSVGYPGSFSPSGPGIGEITNSSPLGVVALDSQGDIWGTPPYGSSACYFELNAGGTVITPAGGNFCASTSSLYANIATDGGGNAWFYNYQGGISKVNAAGNLAATAPTSKGCFYPRASAGSANSNVEYEAVTSNILYDHSHGQLWGYSETGAGAVTNAGAALFCDFGSATLPVVPDTQSSTTIPGTSYSPTALLITSAVLDGAGNLWFTSQGIAGSGVASDTAGSFTGTINFSSWLGEISASGALQTPYNVSAGTYGLKPAGLGLNGTASATNASFTPYVATAGLLGVDIFGNIWAVDVQTNRIFKITGMATANTVNY